MGAVVEIVGRVNGCFIPPYLLWARLFSLFCAANRRDIKQPIDGDDGHGHGHERNVALLTAILTWAILHETSKLQQPYYDNNGSDADLEL